jgi:diketogulonate reductase-like aldo/keto reductase
MDTGVYPAVNQIELNVNSFRVDRVKYCQSKGIHVQGYSPLGKGEVDNKILNQIAAETGMDQMEIAISYLTSQNISIVNKSSKLERIQENLKACEIILPKQFIDRLYMANKSEPSY